MTSIVTAWKDAVGQTDPASWPKDFGSGVAAEFHTLQDAVGIASGRDRGWLEIGGQDSQDFLQRLLTNDLRKLQPGSGQWSAWLDGKGRWISDLLLYKSPSLEQEQWLMDLPASLESGIIEKLELFHFGEDIRWQPPGFDRLMVLGPQGKECMTELGLPIPSSDEDLTLQQRGDFAILRWEEGWILRRPDRGTTCLELLEKTSVVHEVADHLLRKGAQPIGSAALNAARIHGFVPRYGQDFDAESILPETNEWRRASIRKGCYAGQEVVARVNTYGEAPHQLVHLRFAESTENLECAELQDAQGKKLGKVTSWSPSFSQEPPIGMGIVRRKGAVAGEHLWAVSGSSRIAATVAVPDKEPA